PVAFDSIADFLRHGITEPCRPLVTTIACLEHERRCRRLDPRCRGQKVRPLPQSFHESNARPLFPPSGGQPLASAPSTRRQHLASALCRHARAKTVTALTYQLARLIGPLHVRISPLAAPWGRRT